MRSAFRNPNKISPFTVNGMSQLCGFISWLFKINYFNTFVTCVSCLWSLKFDQQVPFPSPPSSHSSENSTMAEWSCPHSPLSPHPPICWWCWAWSPTPPPRPCSATPPPSSLPSFAGNTYLKQEISKSKYFLIWNWIRSSKSCLSINSPMICYEEFWWCLFERGPPLPPGRPSNRLTFTMTPTWLLQKRVKTRSTFQEMFVDWNVEPANQMFSVRIIISSFTHSLTDLYFIIVITPPPPSINFA